MSISSQNCGATLAMPLAQIVDNKKNDFANLATRHSHRERGKLPKYRAGIK
jgi:hypothetical protein